MDAIELVKMSEKGQLVVPQGIREAMNLNPGERFIAFQVNDGILFKKIDIDFESISKEVESKFKKNKIKNADVAEAIRWARKKS
jgi:AbrB family looped-hinge helix DNA binding protein